MQISAISPNFQGKRDRVDELISLNDNSVRRLAYKKTLSRSNEKKHNLITNGLIAASPVAAGLSAAVFSSGKTKIFSKEVSGLAARLANGLKAGGLWGAALGAIGLLGVAKAELAKASPEVRKFDAEHPFLSLGTMLAAGLGVITLVNKGAMKLATKEAPKFMKKATGKVAKFINDNSLVQGMKKGVKKAVAKTPDPLKDVAGTALSWSPHLLLLGGVLHSMSHGAALNREFAKNYNDIKEKQLNLSRARQRELVMENDFLKTDSENREDLELLKDPMADLPDDVVDKIAQKSDRDNEVFDD